MADAVVDGDAGREGDALHQLLVLLEGLAGLLHQPLVTLDAPATACGQDSSKTSSPSPVFGAIESFLIITISYTVPYSMPYSIKYSTILTWP